MKENQSEKEKHSGKRKEETACRRGLICRVIIDSKLSGIPRCSPSSPALPPIYLVAAFERASIITGADSWSTEFIPASRSFTLSWTVRRIGRRGLAERTGGVKCESITTIIIKSCVLLPRTMRTSKSGRSYLRGGGGCGCGLGWYCRGRLQKWTTHL